MNHLDWSFSPFIVPVAGCLMVLGIVVAGIYSEMRGKELRSQERLTLLSRGLSPEQVEQMLTTAHQHEVKPMRDPLRSLANTRRSATVLISSGLGLGAFGLLLWWILQVRPVLIVAATGVINVVIGIGFLVDYQMQKREFSRFYTDLMLDEPGRGISS